MTTEDDFQRALDLHPDDHHTRLVFADWLDERGDVRAAGYRALGVLCKYPATPSGGDGRWKWHRANHGMPHLYPWWLPNEWCDAFYADWSVYGYVWHDSRRQAEDAAALAFAKLPADRRQELLAGPVACGGNG